MVNVVTSICLVSIISKRAGDRSTVPKGSPTGIGESYGESNDQSLDDVTCPVFLFGTDYTSSLRFQNR